VGSNNLVFTGIRGDFSRLTDRTTVIPDIPIAADVGQWIRLCNYRCGRHTAVIKTRRDIIDFHLIRSFRGVCNPERDFNTSRRKKVVPSRWTRTSPNCAQAFGRFAEKMACIRSGELRPMSTLTEST